MTGLPVCKSEGRTENLVNARQTNVLGLVGSPSSKIRVVLISGSYEIGTNSLFEDRVSEDKVLVQTRRAMKLPSARDVANFASVVEETRIIWLHPASMSSQLME